VATAIEHAGAKVLPLPPYSSDYTPIEELWSKAKQYYPERLILGNQSSRSPLFSGHSMQ
jgi:transposase